ncbi:hypothetical protein KBG31_00535 [Patescibacteria group bacterium]|nr:hypothetical protein [Patescibacteria group bacterium]
MNKTPNEWPVYFKERLLVDDINSSIGIVTLWMPKETVAEYLGSGTFSVCGQLYTKGGINYILRNILANPRIKHLIMCGIDRQGSGEALKKFFENGVTLTEDENSSWKIVGDAKALIDKQIPLEYLDLIRKNVTLYDMRESAVEEVGKKARELSSSDICTATSIFCDPIILPDPEKTKIQTYPSDHSVFKVRRDYIGVAWLDALKIVTRFGSKIPGMYGEVGQVSNLSIVIEKEDPDSPEIASFFNFDKEQLDLYYKGFFSKNEGKEEIYTYGERIFNWDGIDQEKIMVEKLSRFEFDRGAMAVLWHPQKDNFPPKDEEVQELGQTAKWRVPCLVMILGQVMNGKFDMTAVFRNNDVYGAWPLNAFALRKFQKNIAQKINKELGTLTTIAHIAEIYELNWEEAINVVQNNYRLDSFCQQDPRGYYIVKIIGQNKDEKEIEVTFYSPDGLTEISTYRKKGMLPKAARDLSLEILGDFLVSDLGAACDLGRQLAKAEAAIKLDLKFEQDQPLSF